MWDFFRVVFETTGITGLLCVLEAILLVIAVRIYQKKEKKTEDLQDQLLKMSEKRREDIIEEREKYEDLAQDLHKSVDLLIRVFKKRNGNNSD
jgi:hypothetical protein